jgi:hypothetical protein
MNSKTNPIKTVFSILFVVCACYALWIAAYYFGEYVRAIVP